MNDKGEGKAKLVFQQPTCIVDGLSPALFSARMSVTDGMEGTSLELPDCTRSAVTHRSPAFAETRPAPVSGLCGNLGMINVPENISI